MAGILKEAFVKEQIQKVTLGEISFSKMVENFNYKLEVRKCLFCGKNITDAPPTCDGCKDLIDV